MSDGFGYARLFSKTAPEPQPRWTGFAPYHFIGGNMDPAEIPGDELADIAATVIRREATKLAAYNLGTGPLGYPALRDVVAAKVGRHRGITCTADEVMITSGSSQAIELICQLMLDPGDTLLFEEASYQGTLNSVRRFGANVVGVPIDRDGLIPEALDQILTDLHARNITPKFLYTIPTIQNPTGSILPLDRRHKILAIAKTHGLPIFEDECYADLVSHGEAPPAFYALAPSQVLHIGSFSKSLAPALRLGYVIADEQLLRRLAALKIDNGTGALEQMIAAEYIAKHFDSQLARLCQAMEAKYTVMETAIAREFGAAAEVWRPAGGIFLWVKFPDVDVRKLSKPAAAAGIEFNAGPDWSCTPDSNADCMRLCFALPTVDQINEGIAALAQVCFEQTGIPTRSANVQRGP